MAITIRVLLFGAASDAAGTRSLELTADKDISAEAALVRLATIKPELGKYKLNVAVNEEHATFETVLRDGDEMAVFTAVSGG